MSYLTRAECNDAADRIVGGNAYGHPVTRYNFDTEAPHTAAQLGEHFVPGIALDAIETSTVHCYDCSLHVDQIVFAQACSKSFQSGLRRANL
jgi:hypothetical protein